MKYKSLKFVVILFFFLIAAGYFSVAFFLPRYIENNILPSLGDKYSTTLTGTVFSIGFNKSSLGNLNIGDSRNIAASIGSIHADYSVSSIFDKKIKQIRINGLTLNLQISEGRLIIPGLDLEKIKAAKNKTEDSEISSVVALPFQLDTLQITDGFLNILYEDQRIFVPFNLQISLEEQIDEALLPAYRLNLQLFPQGEELGISGSVDLANNNGRFAFSADSFDLKPFMFLFEELQDVLTLGKTSIKSNAEIKLIPFQLVATEVECEIKYLNFINVPVSFNPPAGNSETTNSLRLKVKGNGQQWDVTAYGFMGVPLSATIALNSTFKPFINGVRGSGNYEIRVTENTIILSPDSFPITIKGNPELRGDFSTDISPDGSWQAKIKSEDSQENLKLTYNQNSLITKIPSFNIQSNGSVDSAQMQLSLLMSDIHATGSDASEVILPVAKLLGSLNQGKKSGQERFSSGDFSLSLPGVNIKRGSFTGKSDITLNGKMEPQPLQDNKNLQISGELVVSNANAEEMESGLHVNSIEGIIPWQRFPEDRDKTGSIKVSGIKWKNNELGSFEAEINLEDSTYKLDGSFSHSLPGGLVTKITGQAEFADTVPQANLSLQMEQTPFTSLHLGKFDPSLKNSYLSGEFGLDGSFKFDAKGIKGNMDLMMQNGRYEYPEKKYEVKGIVFALQLPFLPELRSSPAQKILFDRASIGELTFEQGKIIWQLESPDSIFIEEGVVRWSKGRVFTNAVRISPNRKEYIVPIFCDRLILADILRQFGITNAEGEGTVSGRIPLLVDKGAVSFEDGFLYSSPGQGGSIKVAAFDLLSTGIPRNNPQFAQVDFAAEALKNFKYNWVKLLFNSEGEDLFMQMQMDGQPMQSLPFSYDSQTGLLQRVEDSSIGIDQPIRLDVNFRLPLNRFLGYSGKIQDIMKKIQ